jgi:hypothetical protein
MKRKTPLQQLKEIFGESTVAPKRLIQLRGMKIALQVGANIAARTRVPAEREALAAAYIARRGRIDALLEWLAKHPAPCEFLDADEMRALPIEDIYGRYREIRRCKADLARLYGHYGFERLVKKLGQEWTDTLVDDLADAAFENGASEEQGAEIGYILMRACSAERPSKYLRACIDNERRANRMAKPTLKRSRGYIFSLTRPQTAPNA